MCPSTGKIRNRYSEDDRQIYYQMVNRFYPREKSVAGLVSRVDSYCISQGDAGAFYLNIPLGTKRTWIAKFLFLHGEGRTEEGSWKSTDGIREASTLKRWNTGNSVEVCGGE